MFRGRVVAPRTRFARKRWLHFEHLVVNVKSYSRDRGATDTRPTDAFISSEIAVVLRVTNVV